jgi:hypothetical protein
MRDGYGEFEYNFGGRMYRGSWKTDKQDGVGFIKEDLELQERKGVWKNGRLVRWVN